MIKIRISYTDSSDMAKIIAALKGFKILNTSKECIKKGHKNIYLELE